MMDCESLRSDLDAVLEGKQGEAARAAAQDHLRRCPACRAYRADVGALREALASHGEGIPAGVRQRLLRRRRAPAAAGLAGAAAAVVLATVVVMLWPGQQVTERRTATVQLEFRSERALSEVRFRVELPDGAELQGHPGRRSLSWEDDLEAGINRLRLPLLFTTEPGGELVARLEHDGRSRELRVPANQLPR